MKNQQIFITGGAGFIGSNIVRYLLDSGGYDITVYDNLSVGSKTSLDRVINESRQKGQVNLIEGDILDYSKLSSSVKNHKAVIHLAAHAQIVQSLENPKENFMVNTVGTFNLLESVRANKEVEMFIMASSNAAVGEQIPPVNEKMVPKPISPYGATKLHGEALCSAYYTSYGIKAVSLRFANAYGLFSEHKTSVVAKYIKRAKQGKPLEIFGDGTQSRDFIHTQDICQVMDFLLCYNSGHCKGSDCVSDSVFGEVYQIATGIETEIIDLAETIRSLSIEFGLEAPEILFKEKREGEIVKNFSDISKAQRSLNFQPQMDFKHSLRDIFNSFD